ncbi:MAG: type II toxin-antitoxin system Phd/YefM family antitoxin [Candidatus Methylacidiphilales bacterium]
MKIKEAGIFEAKTHLSEMISEVESTGVIYHITKRGKKVAEIRPFEKKERPVLKAGYGKHLGPYYMAPDFDEPLEDFKEYM